MFWFTISFFIYLSDKLDKSADMVNCLHLIFLNDLNLKPKGKSKICHFL